MIPFRIITSFLVIVWITACASVPEKTMPVPKEGYPTRYFPDPEEMRATYMMSLPTITPTLTPTLTPTVTPTPTLPPLEEVAQKYKNEIRPRLAQLSTAKSKDGYTLPPSSTWQFQFIPINERDYIVQFLLFNDQKFGNPNGQTQLYITYAYQREGCLSYVGLGCDIENARITGRLYVKEGNTFYLLEELPAHTGGRGAHSWLEIVSQSVYSFKVLDNQGSDVKRAMEVLMQYIAGLDPIDTGLDVFRPALNARIAILKQTLTSPYWSDRRGTLTSLQEIGPDAVDAVPEIIQAMHDEDSRVRGDSISTLASIGPGAVAAVPDLIQFFQNKDEWFRCDAAYALSNIGEGAQESIPVLIAEIESNGKCLRTTAEALERFGKMAASAVPALINLLNNQNAEIREQAVKSLGSIGEPAIDAVPALINALNDENDDIKCRAAETLGKIGPSSSEAVTALSNALDEGKLECEFVLIMALENMGPAAVQAVPALVKALNGKNRILAAEALGHIGPAAIESVPALIQMLEKDEGFFGFEREAAHQALIKITGKDLGEQVDSWQKWWEENKP